MYRATAGGLSDLIYFCMPAVFICCSSSISMLHASKLPLFWKISRQIYNHANKNFKFNQHGETLALHIVTGTEQSKESTRIAEDPVLRRWNGTPRPPGYPEPLCGDLVYVDVQELGKERTDHQGQLRGAVQQANE